MSEVTGYSHGVRQPNEVITWSTYLLSLDDICRWAGIPVPDRADTEADLPDRGVLRLIIKAAK